jgi:hypothetical protein
VEAWYNRANRRALIVDEQIKIYANGGTGKFRIGSGSTNDELGCQQILLILVIFVIVGLFIIGLTMFLSPNAFN